MNLIEQLGGYEQAKSELKDKKWRKDNLHGSAEFTWHMKQHIQLLESVLLEYRRQHNIFEVGDKVVFIESELKNPRLMTVIEVREPICGFLMAECSLGITNGFYPSRYRHATDAEIKANRRLRVLESDDCSEIRNHISPNTVVIDQ